MEGARGSAPQGMLAALKSLTTLAELHPRFFKQSLPGVAAGMSATARWSSCRASAASPPSSCC